MPIILTIHSKVKGAVYFLEESQLDERVQVLSAQQFLSGYLSVEATKAIGSKISIEDIVDKYNDLIKTYEKDLSRRIEVS